jgi:hypothetical protein
MTTTFVGSLLLLITTLVLLSDRRNGGGAVDAGMVNVCGDVKDCEACTGE